MPTPRNQFICVPFKKKAAFPPLDPSGSRGFHAEDL